MVSENLDARLDSVASLAEPIRRALYRYVLAQVQPVSREEAARDVGVALHTAKFHLDRLVDDGLLEIDYRRPPGRSGPGAGRPAKVYRPSGRQIDITLPERRYELAGWLLARAVSDSEQHGVPVGGTVRRSANAAGRALGQEARHRAGPRPSQQTLTTKAIEVLRDYGYEPRADVGGVELANCPFHTLAREYTELICGMNLDFVQGLLAGLRLDRLEATLEPAPSRCCVRLRKSA